ncbi:Uncharacterised protein [Mycobacterium tuberculosis]|nr:Uncharacterised protein [Mycobacterium tuberculosis]
MPGRFTRGFGSDDPSRPSASHRKGWRKFPSPLGVLGLTTSDSISPGGQQISHVSVPSRGFGSDDTWGEGMAMMVDEVSVPSRGFGSDDPEVN